MACGYGIDTKSSELQAGNLDKGHVADLMKEVDKHRRLLGMKKRGSLQDTLPLPCRMRHAVHPAASEPGPSTLPPAKRSKRPEAEQAAESTQPTKAEQATELSKGKAAKAKPTP
ncbi:hypothetical protein QJQ45_016969 [Haematococcus lacustris]|nr:hypothetical protein QJQ45_016969 [Haematococcus lacustris]